jgi:hypothetical protein
MEDGMQHFHEWYRDAMGHHAAHAEIAPDGPRFQMGVTAARWCRWTAPTSTPTPSSPSSTAAARRAPATARCCSTWRYLDPGDLDSDHATRRPNPDFVLNHPRTARRQRAAGARQLRLRLQPRARRMGAARLWLQGRGGAQLRRHLPPEIAPLNGVAAIALAAPAIDQLFAARPGTGACRLASTCMPAALHCAGLAHCRSA